MVQGTLDGAAVGVEVTLGGTAKGLENLLAGSADVAVATRRVSRTSGRSCRCSAP